MKVLQINAVSEIRSTGRTSVETADWLNNDGHEGYIAYSAGLPYNKGYKIGNRIDTKFHALFSRIFGLQGYFSYFATKRLAKYMDKLQPDVVHLRNLHGNFINLRLLFNYLASRDIPTVITLHDCWFYTGKCTHYTTDNCSKWQMGCGKCPRLKKDNPSWFFDRTKKMYRDKQNWFGSIPRLAVVGVSDWITSEARKSFFKSANIVTRIYNWIDMDVFRPVETTELRNRLKLQNKFVILGVASGWSNAKGLDKFIELSREIDSDSIIILIGSLKEKTQLPANIIHIKETHNTTELAEYYSLADVYLHLSREETFGKTIAEALACGTQPIVINSTACGEVAGKECGNILDSWNEDKLIALLRRLKSLNKTPDECFEYAKKRFKKETLINEYIKLYKKISE